MPVRRKPRLDGWTEEKQRRFIETLADTGLVRNAAKAVGMSRENAYRLRRAPHGAAFARAWDAARHHAGGLIEDIAFERAIEGVEHDVYNEYGEVVAARLVHDLACSNVCSATSSPNATATRAVAVAGDPGGAAVTRARAGGEPARDGAGAARARPTRCSSPTRSTTS